MASVHREIQLDRRPEEVWAAVRDVGAVHTQLAIGFVVDTNFEADVRTITFADGMVVQERVVSIDEPNRRLAYTAAGGGLGSTHHHASMQVVPDVSGSRLIWITDVLPDRLAEPIGSRVEQGLEAIKRTLDPA